MKSFLIALIFMALSAATLAEEPLAPAAEAGHEAGEHEAKKPPAGKPGLPITEVQKLPVVTAWRNWEKKNNDSDIITWGETLNTVEGKQCWGVALGETHYDGLHVWRHFCVPLEAGPVWVQKIPDHPDDLPVYMPYDQWVTECKPTEQSPGNC